MHTQTKKEDCVVHHIVLHVYTNTEINT